MWLALQTVTTVGYGDVTPKDAAGRFVAAVVMLEGIASSRSSPPQSPRRSSPARWKNETTKTPARNNSSSSAWTPASTTCRPPRAARDAARRARGEVTARASMRQKYRDARTTPCSSRHSNQAELRPALADCRRAARWSPGPRSENPVAAGEDRRPAPALVTPQTSTSGLPIMKSACSEELLIPSSCRASLASPPARGIAWLIAAPSAMCEEAFSSKSVGRRKRGRCGRLARNGRRERPRRGARRPHRSPRRHG